MVNPLSSSRTHSAPSTTSETPEEDYILLPDMPSPGPRTQDTVMKSPNS